MGFDFDSLCTDVANGISIVEWCRNNALKYGEVIVVIYKDPALKQRYEDCLNAGKEYMCIRIIDELKNIGLSDPRKAFDKEGNLLSIADMPEDMARVVSGFDTEEKSYGKDDNTTFVTTKKMKMWDKLKALELLMKQQGMLVERMEHSGKMTLEDLVGGSRESVTVPPVNKDV